MKDKKRLTLKYTVLFIVLCALVSCSFYKSINLTRIGEGKVSFSYSEDSLLLVDRLIFDTGSELSLILDWSDLSYSKKKKYGSIKVIGLDKTSNKEDIYYVKSLYLDTINVRKTFVVQIESDRLSKQGLQILNNGVIGMNIISKSNWFINFKDMTIESRSHDDYIDSLFKSPVLKFSYHNKLYPQTSFFVNDIEIKDILIDSGASHSIKFSSSQKEEILQKSKILDSLSVINLGLYSNLETAQPVTKYRVEQLKVNDVTLEDIWIQFTDVQKPSIGIAFLRKYEKVYINTNDKYIAFY